MKHERIWRLALLLTLASCLSSQAAEEPPNLTGVWMPTAIGPTGERNQVFPEQIPYIAEIEDGLAAFQANFNPEVDDISRSCLPYGIPRQMAMRAQYPTEIIQTPTRITLIFELHNDIRYIHLDGRKHPQGLLPTWMGYSTGHWEGQELHVQTRAIREQGYPNPQSRELVVDERVRVVESRDAGPMLEWQMTLTDPRVYTEPVVIRNYFRQYPGLQMGEYFCTEDLWRQNLDDRSGNIPWR